MMTIVYDLQATWGSNFDVDEDYYALLDFFEELALTDSSNCRIRLDMGSYFIMAKGQIGLTRYPQIHIMLEGKNIHQTERWIELQLADLKNFNSWERYTYAEKVLTKQNLKLFNEHSQLRALFALKNAKTRKITIDQPSRIKANIIEMKHFGKR